MKTIVERLVSCWMAFGGLRDHRCLFLGREWNGSSQASGRKNQTLAYT